MSAQMQSQSQSQYAAAARAPLIKSPSIRVPPPVELPPDIHPLPDSVTEYFAYPFTLEPHVLAVESARRATLAAHAARRAALLAARDAEKARRRRDALRRIAPGFEPRGTPLVPVPVPAAVPASESALEPAPESAPGDGGAGAGTGTPAPDAPRSVMADLVDQLAALEATARAPSRG